MMTSPVGTSPLAGAEVRIRSAIRSAGVGACFIVFNPETGRFLTLQGRAAAVWEALGSGDNRLENDQQSLPYLAEFAARGLVDPPRGVFDVVEPFAVPAGEILDHHQFDHLILQEPEIDSSLVGNPVRISLPPSSQRTLLERLKIRTFFSSFLEESRTYAERQDMIKFVLQLGSAKVLVQIPATNPSFADSFSRAFFSEPWSEVHHVDFTVTVFDNAFGERMTSPYFEADWHFPLGIVDYSRTRPYRVGIDRHTQTVSAYSPEDHECVVWMRAFDSLPYWSAATPLRLQLSWIADTLGLEFLHSAAVKVDDKAVLFGGPSGSGKSTLVLSLAGLHFPLISDDFLLSLGTTVQAVYRRVKVHDWSAQRVLPKEWEVLNEDEAGQKRIVEPARDLFREELPIGALIVPQVGRVVGLTAIDPCDAASAIAPASLSGLLGGNEQSLERISRLVEGFPTYRLEVTPDLVQKPEHLRAIIQEISLR